MIAPAAAACERAKKFSAKMIFFKGVVLPTGGLN
jgi:hypothetical protein